MYTVRLFRHDDIQLVFSAHSYVVAPNYVTLTRYDANREEESIQFFVDDSAEPNYKRIEITNSSGLKVDAIVAIPRPTQQMISEAVKPPKKVTRPRSVQ